MLESGEIGNIGENIVGDYLKKKGLQCTVNTSQPGKTDIEAVGKKKGHLIQVKTALYPNKPKDLSDEEIQYITNRARRKGFYAWKVKLQIDEDEDLVGTIKFIKLYDPNAE